MSDTTPAFQFYPGDWKRDPALRSVSLAARGFWIELLGSMHDARPRGYLRHPAGRPYKIEELARMAGCSTDEARAALAELDEAGVLTRDEAGVIYSDRMVRDEAIREARRTAGSKGGSNRASKAQANTPANGQAGGEQPRKQKAPPSSSSSVKSIGGSTLLGNNPTRTREDALPQEHPHRDGLGSEGDPAPTLVAAGRRDHPELATFGGQGARDACDLADLIEAPLRQYPDDRLRVVHGAGQLGRAMAIGFELEMIADKELPRHRPSTVDLREALSAARAAAEAGDPRAADLLFGLRNWPDGAMRGHGGDLRGDVRRQPSRLMALVHWHRERKAAAKRSGAGGGRQGRVVLGAVVEQLVGAGVEASGRNGAHS